MEVEKDKPLFEKTTGAYVTTSLVYSLTRLPGYTGPNWWSSWPFAKIKFYNDYLRIEMVGKSVTLEYKNIDLIEWQWWAIWIRHHDSNVNKYIRITGSGNSHFLFKNLKKAILENNLKIRVR